MKKEIKGFVCGVIAATTLGAIGTFAAGVWENIPVLKNDIKVVVNGNEVTSDNFLYNDTTYLPLRAVSTALSVNVEYDEITNTAYIGGKEDSKIVSKYVPEDINIKISSYLKDGIYYLNVRYIIDEAEIKNINVNTNFNDVLNRVDTTKLVIGDKSWLITEIDSSLYIPYDTYVDEIEPLLR